MPEKDFPPEAAEHLHLFRKSLPIQLKLFEIMRAMGRTEGLMCLDVGSANALVSYQFRKRGGSWHTAVKTEELAQSFRGVLGENVHVFSDQKVPFKNKVFDIVVVNDLLDKVESAERFIEECHRVLKPDGRLIVHVKRIKSWTLISPLRSALGVTYEAEGMVRAGYTEQQLFRVLKDGFDVLAMRSYSRFFVELTDTIVRFALRRIERRGGDRQKLFTIAGVFYQIMAQLDLLLFFTRGFNLIATAKRRAWRPRNAPVLIDGRSISEAVLSKPAV